MKISENRRKRGEKKAMARQDHQSKQNSRFEKKYVALAEAVASGDEEAAKEMFARMDVILKQAGKTPEDFQELVTELRKQAKDAKDNE